MWGVVGVGCGVWSGMGMGGVGVGGSLHNVVTKTRPRALFLHNVVTKTKPMALLATSALNYICAAGSLRIQASRASSEWTAYGIKL